ncbi:cobalt ECF transporter T component CbiQ, partial [Carboxydocella sp. JDF658]|uniref:cobalt ECF transporter T component CbiQ n=1 Tax=Carboxydocella sp. JDF658 TaxID=1926600 RepID=UPI0009ABED20
MCNPGYSGDLLNNQSGRSPLWQLDTRLKILSLFSVVVIFSTLKNILLLTVAALVLLGIALLARITHVILMKRLVWLLPFAGIMVLLFPFITPGQPLWTANILAFKLTATVEGGQKALFLALRVLNAVLAMTILTETTPRAQLLQGLRQLGLPDLLVNLIAFTLRYFSLLGSELERMQTARKARGFQRGKGLYHWRTMKTLGQMVGMLFLRAADRGDRIYTA